MGKRFRYYMVVNKNDNPVTINAALPIFWYKHVAEDKRRHHFGDNPDYKVIAVLVQPVK